MKSHLKTISIIICILFIFILFVVGIKTAVQDDLEWIIYTVCGCIAFGCLYEVILPSVKAKEAAKKYREGRGIKKS